MWTTTKKLELIQQMMKYRQERGIVLEEMAHRVGVSFVTVCRWENGKGLPHKLMCDRIAAVINTKEV